METLARQSCAEHPDRHSFAICMSCRKVLCQECTTPWEGINYCRGCVATLAATPLRRSGPIPLILMIVFGAAMAVALVRLIVGVGVYLAGML